MKTIIAFIQKAYRTIKSPFSAKKHKVISFSALEDNILEELNSLNSLTNEQKRIKNDDIKKMIEYTNTLTSDIENRRSKLVEFSWQTIPILLTATGLLIAFNLRASILIPIVLLFLIQFIASLCKLIIYQIQSGFRYPFLYVRKFSNKWKWFYYGNDEIIKIDPIRNKPENIEHYLKGLSHFIRKYKDEDIDMEIKDNIQQLYLLQVHNFFKNRFYLQLNSIDITASKCSLIFILVIIGLYLGIILSTSVFHIINYDPLELFIHF